MFYFFFFVGNSVLLIKVVCIGLFGSVVVNVSFGFFFKVFDGFVVGKVFLVS